VGGEEWCSWWVGGFGTLLGPETSACLVVLCPPLPGRCVCGGPGVGGLVPVLLPRGGWGGVDM
jgi:hypothetical protein